MLLRLLQTRPRSACQGGTPHHARVSVNDWSAGLHGIVLQAVAVLFQVSPPVPPSGTFIVEADVAPELAASNCKTLNPHGIIMYEGSYSHPFRLGSVVYEEIRRSSTRTEIPASLHYQKLMHRAC